MFTYVGPLAFEERTHCVGFLVCADSRLTLSTLVTCLYLLTAEGLDKRTRQIFPLSLMGSHYSEENV